jgi:NDP-mannose synthase
VSIHGYGNGNGNGYEERTEILEELTQRVGSAGTGQVRLAAVNRPKAQTSVSKAVILAGGRGTRLAPYTSTLPKPLMPVGDRSILELVVDQLELAGINDISFCVGYLSHLIRAVFDHRDNEGVEIDYVHEHEALGTAGPLRLVGDLDETFIAMNGDVLTNLDYTELVRYHQRHGNMLTIATHDRRIKIDYGVLGVQELGMNGNSQHRITEFQEKPEIVSTVSMGIYVMEPGILDHVPEGQAFDLPDLVQALLRANQPVGAFKYDGLWFDIGRKEDYERAVEEWFGQVSEDDAGAEGHVITEAV